MRTSKLKLKVVRVMKITRTRMENKKRTKVKLASSRIKRRLMLTLAK